MKMKKTTKMISMIAAVCMVFSQSLPSAHARTSFSSTSSIKASPVQQPAVSVGTKAVSSTAVSTQKENTTISFLSGMTQSTNNPNRYESVNTATGGGHSVNVTTVKPSSTAPTATRETVTSTVRTGTTTTKPFLSGMTQSTDNPNRYESVNTVTGGGHSINVTTAKPSSTAPTATRETVTSTVRTGTTTRKLFLSGMTQSTDNPNRYESVNAATGGGHIVNVTTVKPSSTAPTATREAATSTVRTEITRTKPFLSGMTQSTDNPNRYDSVNTATGGGHSVNVTTIKPSSTAPTATREAATSTVRTGITRTKPFLSGLTQSTDNPNRYESVNTATGGGHSVNVTTIKPSSTAPTVTRGAVTAPSATREAVKAPTASKGSVTSSGAIRTTLSSGKKR